MGGFRSQPDLTKHTTAKDSISISYAVSHMCGWRDYMEDASIAVCLSDKKSYLFGVFDGHGGAEVATFVQRHFVKELELNSNYKKKNYELALKQTFLKMDELMGTKQGMEQVAIIQKQMKDKKNASEGDQIPHAGCTANVCLVTPEFIYVANAGDSRSIYSNSKHQVKQLSKDHKPQIKAQSQRIIKAGGEIYMGRINGNLNLSRALGDLQYKLNSQLKPEQQMITGNPEITKVKHQNIEFIVMGCDGIWEVKTNCQIANFVRTGIQEKKNLGKIAEQLMDMLVAKDSQSGEHGMDNMSVILIKFPKHKR